MQLTEAQLGQDISHRFFFQKHSGRAASPKVAGLLAGHELEGATAPKHAVEDVLGSVVVGQAPKYRLVAVLKDVIGMVGFDAGDDQVFEHHVAGEVGGSHVLPLVTSLLKRAARRRLYPVGAPLAVVGRLRLSQVDRKAGALLQRAGTRQVLLAQHDAFFFGHGRGPGAARAASTQGLHFLPSPTHKFLLTLQVIS